MSKIIKKHARLAVIVILISMIVLPNSAYASSAASSTSHTSSYATSFFSSLTGAIASFFEKDKNTYTNPGSDTDNGNKSIFGWLKGKNSWGDWWDCKENDSNSMWEKYYHY